MLGIRGGDNLESVAFASGVTGSLDSFVRNRNAWESRRQRAQRDKKRSTAIDVGAQVVLETGRQRADVGEHHERVFGKRLVGGLTHFKRLQHEAGLGHGFERGAVVKLSLLLAGGVKKQHGMR